MNSLLPSSEGDSAAITMQATSAAIDTSVLNLDGVYSVLKNKRSKVLVATTPAVSNPIARTAVFKMNFFRTPKSTQNR